MLSAPCLEVSGRAGTKQGAARGRGGGKGRCPQVLNVASRGISELDHRFVLFQHSEIGCIVFLSFFVFFSFF